MEPIDYNSYKKNLIKRSPSRWVIAGFTKMPNSVTLDIRVNKNGLLVFLVLATHQFKKDSSFPSLALLQKETRSSRNSVIRGIENLKELSYLKIEKTSGKVNKYYLKSSINI